MSACEEMICIEGDCIRQNRGAAGAPKGRKDSARGFNPGCNVLTGRALLVRRSSASASEGGKGHQMELEWSNPRNISVRKEMVRSGATFPPSSRIPELRRTGRGHPFTTDNPGLKPRAASNRPFGAAQTSLSRFQSDQASTPFPYSTTPSLHHSITPSLPLLRAPRSSTSTSTTPLTP